MPAITFSGLASGIDADAIIKTMLDARRLASEPMKNKRDFNTKENEALEELNTKLLGLRDVLQDFMTLNGTAVSKAASSSNSDAVEASASASSVAGSTTITVEQLAQAATFSFDDRFTSRTAALAPGLSSPGSINVTVGSGTDAQTYNIPVSSATTLDDVVNNINQQGLGRVRATAINLGTDAAPSYALVISSQETGLATGTLDITASPELTGAGIFASSTLDQAKDALLTVSGIGQITRSTNEIKGIIPGVTMTLKQAMTGPVLVSVTDDKEKTAGKFEKFSTLFNELVDYVKQRNTIERVEEKGKLTNIYGELAKTRVDDQALDAIRNAVGSAQSGIPNATVNILADLGLTTERDGTYKFDHDKFVAGVNEDPIAASKLLNAFADKVASASGVIEQYTRFQGTIDSAVDANKSENESINERLDRLEESLAKQEQAMRLMFTNLERKTSELNSASSALSSMIASVSTNRR